MSQTVTQSWGSNEGTPFSLQPVKSLRLRTGRYIDAIVLNGARYGGTGGGETDVIHFDNDEYISEVVIRSGAWMDYLSFTTTDNGKEPSEVFGGGGGGNEIILKGIRVLGIGGVYEGVLNYLSLMYVKDYEPSTPVEGGRGLDFILDYLHPGQTITEYDEVNVRSLEAFEKTSQHMTSLTASVKAEYFGKASFSGETKIVNTTTETIRTEFERESRTARTVERTIPEGSVGLVFATGNLMKSAEGEYWMYPTGPVTNSQVALTDTEAVKDCYDLTGSLEGQMSSLKPLKKIKYGFDCY